MASSSPANRGPSDEPASKRFGPHGSSAVPPRVKSFNRIRLTLARYLALALEFQLGADSLSTAIAPSWDQIGKLGAIAIIRTALNFFLTREMRDESESKELAVTASGPGEKE